MPTSNENKLGEVVLFNSKKDKSTSPDFEGKMTTTKGQFYVKMWKEKKESVTGGEYMKGYVYSIKEDQK